MNFGLKEKMEPKQTFHTLIAFGLEKKLMKYRMRAEGPLKTSLLSTNITMFIQQLVN